MQLKRFFQVAAALAAVGLLVDASAQVRDDSKRDRVDVERDLDQMREQIHELAEEMSRLSLELSDGSVRHIFKSVAGDPHRAMLGVSIASDGEDDGVRIAAVTPDGPADRAGLKSGDVIVALDGVALAGGGDGVEQVLAHMGKAAVGDTVAVDYRRDGRRVTAAVTTESLGSHPLAFAFSTSPDVEFEFSGEGDIDAGSFAELQDYVFDWHAGPWSDMELVELTPQLGAYFGVHEGLLVVRAPRDPSLAVQDGDVIVKLDGDPVSTPRQFMRKLRRREAGTSLSLDIVRQEQSIALEAQMPERDEQLMGVPGTTRRFLFRDKRESRGD